MYMQSYGRNNSGSGRSGGFRSRFRKSAPRKSVQYEHSRFIKKAKPVEITQYTPKHSFTDFAVCDQIKANLTAKGFTSPTAIQDQAIPILLTNQDLVGIANTGTGKTGAFLIPLLEKINNNRGNEKVLVMVPTRELAIQIETELRAFSRNMNISSVLCIGGTPIGQQIRALGRKFDFVIGTPGRLKDLVNRRLLNLEHFKSVVLDEVDRMLDMGFIADIRILMAKLPKERQTLFFSATMDKTIEPLMHEFLVSPAKVSVKTGETSDNVEQDVVRFSRIEEKTEILSNLLNTIESEQILIFDRTKGGVEDLCYELNQRGFKAVSIHGDKSQSHRFLALKQFKANHAKILVATDVAARGLDMNVSHVINFDTPDNYETYVHRIGRTGRAGKTGVALTFVRG